MLVSVGSKNRVKIEAVSEALKVAGINAELISVDAESGVSKQPFCDDTFTGARNRARNSLRENVDIGIGIEGGICEYRGKMLAFAVVHCSHRDGRENFSTSASFTLPEDMAKLVKGGMELGEATDIIFNDQGSKSKIGAVGYLSKGLITRTALYVQPVLLALYPFI
jgi:inosine/xanthosine triphosphatase